MAEEKPYASAMASFLDRDDGTEKKAMMYPITRIELYEFTGTGIVKTRSFIAVADGVRIRWREEQ